MLRRMQRARNINPVQAGKLTQLLVEGVPHCLCDKAIQRHVKRCLVDDLAGQPPPLITDHLVRHLNGSEVHARSVEQP